MQRTLTRGKIKRNTEISAKQKGIAEITVDVMYAAGCERKPPDNASMERARLRTLLELSLTMVSQTLLLLLVLE